MSPTWLAVLRRSRASTQPARPVRSIQNNGSNDSQKSNLRPMGPVFTSCSSATLGCVQIEDHGGGSRDVYTYANDAFLTGGPKFHLGRAARKATARA